jgi:hypothetical protein
LSAALGRFAPQLKGAAAQLLSAAAAVGLGVVQFFISIVVVGLLLANSSQGARTSRKLAIHLSATGPRSLKHSPGPPFAA